MEKNKKYSTTSLSSEDIDSCISILEHLVENSEDLTKLKKEQRILLLTAAGKLSRPDRSEYKKRRKDAKNARNFLILEKNRHARETTGIRSARNSTVFKAPEQISTTSLPQNPPIRVLNSPRNCYICKKEFTQLHFFYDSLCIECAEFNYKKRFQRAPLNGTTALITGARVKIGYQTTLKMLRAGCTIIGTTRFPVDAALRYSSEEDFPKWKHRLHLHGLDLRHTPSVEIFTRFFLQTYKRLDMLINNAAQTVRRPPGYYTHLMANEKKDSFQLPKKSALLLANHERCTQHLTNLCHQNDLVAVTTMPNLWNAEGPGIGLRFSAQLSGIPYSFDKEVNTDDVFPQGKLDVDLQQIDLRKTNSWRLRLGDIQTPEMLEVQLVNAVAPFVLCNRLVPLMKLDYTGQKHIVNVSAMEGKFLRFKKDERHPHTNMAKAALNMLTHTAAQDLAKYGIFINAVDTGWVTDEDPVELAQFKKEKHDFQPPLDIVDGAARVCDPFFHGINTGSHWSGKFLKDYKPIDW